LGLSNGLVLELVYRAVLKTAEPKRLCGFDSHQGHMKKQNSKEQKIKHSEEYIEFLRKRLASENYKASVTKEEYDKTKAKLDKEKLILKFLKS